MKVKELWTDKDFEEMGWHDSHIHSIGFSNDNMHMILDIDYLFEWVLNEKTGFYDFYISPCYLIFYYTLNLKIELDYRDNIGLDIEQIIRTPMVSPNGTNMYKYKLETHVGNITFTASHFIQKVRQQPVYSESQVLERPEIII